MHIDYGEVKERYTEIIKDLLTQRFGDEIVFDPIVIKADPEVCPDPETPSLFAYIAFNGDDSKLDYDFRTELTEELWPHAIELGFPSVPVQEFVPKANWDRLWPEFKAWFR